MIDAILLAGGLALGAKPASLAVLSVVVFLPLPSGIAAAGLVWLSRRKHASQSYSFCQSVAAELRSGAGLRHALHSAAASVGLVDLASRLHGSVPMDQIGRELGREFTDIGAELRTLVARSGELGAPTADLFDELGSYALHQIEIGDEIRTQTTPARAAAAVMLGVPLLVLVGSGFSGSLARYLASSTQRGAVLVGLTMTAVGLVTGAVLIRERR